MLISSVVPNYRKEVLYGRTRPRRVLRRARLRAMKRYVFVLRISGCSGEHTPPYSFSLSQGGAVGAAAVILLRDGYPHQAYFADGDGGIGVCLARDATSSSFLWKTNEPSLDDIRHPRTALLGLFGESSINRLLSMPPLLRTLTCECRRRI